ncbi:FeoA domain-containing protein [Candidatus Caldatribacterium saccharofermentans]|uniref:Ferrous iron transport protein A n=1 Tax=Candidatus Caldatribacterium saccharofermentans TaxID=1454753 RepID=A0A7V4WL55_9BACT
MEDIRSLVEMETGGKGEIVRIDGGEGMVRRLWVLGVVPGKRIEKVSSIIGKGPVVIRLGQQEIALGRGIAQRILVRVEH